MKALFVAALLAAWGLAFWVVGDGPAVAVYVFGLAVFVAVVFLSPSDGAGR